jgi:2-methylisocitrate lyase-like PEP mutase family enzyme
VWIVTDNADYSDLGILVDSQSGFGGSRVINEQETARAMKICDEAGIDITRKAIWRDRQKVISGLKDAELRKWLEQKK